MTDPRYDPRFQRGYAGPGPDAVAEPEAPGSPREARPVSWQPEPPRPVGAFPPEPVVDPSPDAPRTEQGSDDLDEPGVTPRRDPYRLALLVVSLVLLVIAGELFWQIARPPETAGGGGYTIMMMAPAALPAFVLAGLVGLIVWLALGALRRR